jgi:hypothetical protein
LIRKKYSLQTSIFENGGSTNFKEKKTWQSQSENWFDTGVSKNANWFDIYFLFYLPVPGTGVYYLFMFIMVFIIIFFFFFPLLFCFTYLVRMRVALDCEARFFSSASFHFCLFIVISNVCLTHTVHRYLLGGSDNQMEFPEFPTTL